MSRNSHVFTVTAKGLTLQDAVAEKLGVSRRKAKQALDDRRVFVNGQRIWMARHALNKGDRVEVAASVESGGESLKTLFEAAGLCVIDKPPGLLSNGPRSVEHRLRRTNTSWRAVHRLDRDTSGCLLFADSEALYAALVEQFKQRAVAKTYEALVWGRIDKKRFSIGKPIDGQPARTDVQALKAGKIATHVRVHIHTGRTHQIRRHLADIGHPVAGDKQYGPRQVDRPEMRAVPRQLLHAKSLGFTHPKTGKKVRVEAPLPDDFKGMLKRLHMRSSEV